MTIKTLVLSGGAYKGLYMMGAISYLKEKKYIKTDKIKKFYCISVGGLVAVLMALDIPWEELFYYIQKRPWDKLINITPDMLVSMLYKKGFFNINVFYTFLRNLFVMKNISIDITFKEFYELNGKEIYLYAYNVSNSQLEEISWRTRPNQKLVEGLYQSCSLPFVFEPIMYNGSYYIDGNIICSYPLQLCLESGLKRKEILCIRIDSTKRNMEITEKDNVFMFGFTLFSQLAARAAEKYIPDDYHGIHQQEDYQSPRLKGEKSKDSKKDKKHEKKEKKHEKKEKKQDKKDKKHEKKEKPIKELFIPALPINKEHAMKFLREEAERKKMIDAGINFAKLYLKYLKR